VAESGGVPMTAPAHDERIADRDAAVLTLRRALSFTLAALSVAKFAVREMAMQAVHRGMCEVL